MQTPAASPQTHFEDLPAMQGDENGEQKVESGKPKLTDAEGLKQIRRLPKPESERILRLTAYSGIGDLPNGSIARFKMKEQEFRYVDEQSKQKFHALAEQFRLSTQAKPNESFGQTIER